MSGLLLIISEAEGERFAAGMELAAASAALGRPVAVLLRGPAVAAALGSPGPFQILFDLGVDVGVCQTSMAAHGLSAETLPSGASPTGMVAFLSGRECWQSVLA